MSYLPIKSVFSYIQDETPPTDGDDGLLGITSNFLKMYILINHQGFAVSGTLTSSDYLPVIRATNITVDGSTLITNYPFGLVNSTHEATDGEISKNDLFTELFPESSYNNTTNKTQLIFETDSQILDSHKILFDISDFSIKPVSFLIKSGTVEEREGIHLATDYQVATDLEFTNLLLDEQENTMAKTELVFYKKMKYKAKIDVTDIKTPIHFKISTEAVTISTDFVHNATDGQIATDPNFTNLIVDIQDSTENLTYFEYTGV